MASYTDQISQFNPYISRMPLIEEMSKVGMEKQAKYDQGVQKIQAYVDNIAGMDVMKDNQKEYLQSKLNTLGSRLKTVAAGDFSNQQLVNSVGGMATQIVKDPVVQSAVYSTQRVRKAQGELEAARKTGKSSPENEAYFNRGVSEWLSDGDLKSTYNGNFNEYVDVDKKLRDIADKIHEVDNSMDIPYKRNADGSVILNANGKPIVDDAMLRIKTKGKPAQKILDNFYESLDEKDKQQLKITGWYHYQGADKETFKKDIVNNYSNQKKLISDNVVDMGVELKTNDKLTSAQRSALQAKINADNALLKSGKLDKIMNEEIAGIDSIQNLDDYKYKLYTQKHLTNLAKDLSYQSTQQEILSNPYKQVELDIVRINQAAEIARQAHLDRMSDLSLRERQFQYQMTKDTKEAQGSRVTPAGIPTGVDKPSLIALNASIAQDQKNIDLLNTNSGTSLFPGYNETERKKSLDALYSKYLTNPKSITNNDERDYVEGRRVLEAKKTQKNKLSEAILQQSGTFDTKLNNLLSGEAPVTFSNGKVLYTAQQLYELDKDASAFYKTTGAGVGVTPYGASTAKTEFDSKSFLNKYKGTALEPAATAYVKKYYGQQLTPTEQIIYNKGKQIRGKYDPQAQAILAEKLDFQANQLGKFMPELQVQRGTLNPTASKADAASIEDLLTTKYAQYNEKGALDLESKAMFSPETISSWRTGKGAADVKYSLEKNPDGSARMIIQKGTETQTVPLKSEELRIFFPTAAQSNPFTDIKFNVLSSTNHTTNAANVRGDASGAVGAYLSGYNVPGLASTRIAPRVRFDVEGSSNNDGSGSDKYQVRMYAMDDNGLWKTQVLNQGGWATEAGVMEILNNVGTTTYNEVLKSR